MLNMEEAMERFRISLEGLPWDWKLLQLESIQPQARMGEEVWHEHRLRCLYPQLTLYHTHPKRKKCAEAS